jgi:transposase
MTQKEITRLRVINQTIDKVITIREAAELLNLSERQVIRLKGGVIQEGAAFIIHKNRGRKPKHAVPDKTRDSIIELKQTKYEEANFNHFQKLPTCWMNVTILQFAADSIVRRLLIKPLVPSVREPCVSVMDSLIGWMK